MNDYNIKQINHILNITFNRRNAYVLENIIFLLAIIAFIASQIICIK